MKFLLITLFIITSSLASASTAAQEASNTQTNVKSTIYTQTIVAKNIRSLYVENIVDTKKIVFNSEIEIKVKTEEK